MTNQEYFEIFGIPSWDKLEPKEKAPSTKEVEDYFAAIIRATPEEDEASDAMTTTEGRKFDHGKPDYTLLPFGALQDVVKVLGFGAVKYGRDNWQAVERQRYVAAAFRHLVAIAKGEELDEESGMPHAAHLSCCSLFLGELGSIR